MACACNCLFLLPVEEKAAIGLRVRLQLPFLPACRERGRLKDLACAYNGLFRLPVEEKAIMRLACRGQDYFSTRQVCVGPHRLGDFAPLPRPQCRSAAAPRGKLVPSPDRGEEFPDREREKAAAFPEHRKLRPSRLPFPPACRGKGYFQGLLAVPVHGKGSGPDFGPPPGKEVRTFMTDFK